MATKRHVLEGVWSGYHSSQRRPCHREVITHPQLYDGIDGIVFTDGTTMELSVRPCKPREKVDEIRGYSKLLLEVRASGLKGWVRVQDLASSKAAAARGKAVPS